MDTREMLKCVAEPLHTKDYESNLVFGQPYVRSDGSAVLISDNIGGMVRVFDVKPETIRRFTGDRRKDGFVYERDVYENEKGDELTVVWSEETHSWMCKYTKTSNPKSILFDTKMALYVMPAEFKKKPYVPVGDTAQQV